MLSAFLFSIGLFTCGVMIFLKFLIEKNPLKAIGLLMVLIFGLSSYYLYEKAIVEGTQWVHLDRSREVFKLAPFESESYLQENEDFYLIQVEEGNLPLKIPKENATLANSNMAYKNEVVKEITIWVSTKADNDYAFLGKEGCLIYKDFYYIYVDY